MIPALSWYLVLSLLGWASFPIAYRFLSRLPDRGLSLARPLALLLWAFIFWILGSYGLLANNLGGILFSLGLLLTLSCWALRSLGWGRLTGWLKENLRLISIQELLFLLAFFAMAYIRAHNPGATSTEKPMELAFINGIIQSPSMPPQDPWLSGFSISYYYFGYLMLSMLAQLTNTLGSYAFNLGLAMVFAMGALGAYGLAYNLLSLLRPDKPSLNRFAALLAPLFVLILGNFTGLLEVMHASHLFWNPGPDGVPVSSFWSWLDIKELNAPPLADPSFIPSRFNWTWRASRVIHDVNFFGVSQELIDEFPAFSFVLGDLHPHVFSIPFAFLTLGLGLNLYRGAGYNPKEPGLLGLHLHWSQFAFLVVVLGSLAFINIWDFPIYLVFFFGVYLLLRANDVGWAWARLLEALRAFIVLAIAGVLLYLPFHMGFSSQAAGLLPNLLNPTRGVQLWVMFGPLFIPLLGFYLVNLRESKGAPQFWRVLLIAAAFVLALAIFAFALAWLYATVLGNTSLGQFITNGLGAPDLQSLFAEGLSRRLAAAGGWLTLIILLAFALRGLLAKVSRSHREDGAYRQALTFFFLLGLFATLLILAPEFVYLRDQFGTRMNTVFKFYFQAWLVLGVLASVGSVLWLDRAELGGKIVARFTLTAVILAAFIYPFFAFPYTYQPSPDRPLTLDGGSFMGPSAQAGVHWLRSAPPGVLVEAVEGSYNPNYALYATQTGLPTVLGWPGHESQWRGGHELFASRQGDIATLYSTPDWNQAQEVIRRYDIRYVIISNTERATYNLSETKFQANLELVYENEALSIYQVH